MHGVPCITRRDETEWVELVERGATVLVGAEALAIATAVLDRAPLGSKDAGLYGEGGAAERIGEVLTPLAAGT